MIGLNLAFLGDPDSVHVRRWPVIFVRQVHLVHLLVTAEREAEARLAAADGVRRLIGWLRPAARAASST